MLRWQNDQYLQIGHITRVLAGLQLFEYADFLQVIGNDY